jgi:hypothetical protein
MRTIGAGVVMLALLGTASAPILAQPKAAEARVSVRVFEGPS